MTDFSTDRVLAFRRIVDESREFKVDEVDSFVSEYQNHNIINRRVIHLFSINEDEDEEFVSDCIINDKF